MKKRLKVFVLVILVSLLGGWSLTLWFGYTVPVILHDDTEVPLAEASELLLPLAGLDLDQGNWTAYLILDPHDFKSLKGRFSRNVLKLTDREVMRRMRDDWKLIRTGGDAATVGSRITFLQEGKVIFSSGIVLEEGGLEGLQSRYFGWAEPQTSGILLEHCTKFKPVYWPLIIL